MNICDEVLNLCEIHNPFAVESVPGRSPKDARHFITMDNSRIGTLFAQNINSPKRITWMVLLHDGPTGDDIKGSSKQKSQIKKVVKDWIKFTGKIDSAVFISED